MKNLFLALILIIIISCGSEQKNEKQNDKPSTETIAQKVPYASFGAQIEKDEAISAEALNELYLGLEVGDTIDVKFASNINSVCKKKGCWMKLDLAEDKETMVRFKDYGFFVPKNSQGKEVIVQGIAFKDVTSVEELKHYAEDEGKSQDEIDAITEPKVTYAITATGVLVQGEDKEFLGQVEGVNDDEVHVEGDDEE